MTSPSAAADGDPSTYWCTETYAAGLQKPAGGLVLDTGRATRLQRLAVSTDTFGYVAVIQASSSPTGPFRAISAPSVVSARTAFALGGPADRYYLVWITRLDHAAHITEVEAFGVSNGALP